MELTKRDVLVQIKESKRYYASCKAMLSRLYRIKNIDIKTFMDSMADLIKEEDAEYENLIELMKNTPKVR